MSDNAFRYDTDHDVIITGGGPNGLLLATELALGGVRAIVLDTLPGPSTDPKANGLVGQVVRLLDMRGLYPEFAAALPQHTFGEAADMPVPLSQYIFSGLHLDLAALRSNPMYGLSIPQPLLARLLADRADTLGAELRWGHRLLDFITDGDRVAVTIAGPDGEYHTTTKYLVGADGGTSTVRKRLGIPFPGSTTGNRITRIGHAEIPAELRTPDGGIDVPGAGRFHFGHNRIERGGMFVFAELTPGLPMVGVTEYIADPATTDTPMTFEELRTSVRRLLGVELPMRQPSGPGPYALRRMVDQNTRLAEHYRRGPVLLLGDAAHVHSAMGGPGLNLGLQDAINLGWKLAAVLRGTAPAGLLDSYESERRPVAERVMMHSLSQSALVAPGPEITALRTLFAELMEIPEVSAQLAALLAGSDVRYDVGDDHPLSGRLVPDLTLDGPDGARRIADLLHSARPVLLDLGAGAATRVAGWADRVDIVTATLAGTEPRIGALLIRPDGYIAWATADSDLSGVTGALTRWFGPARVGAPAGG